jgi:malic enzyme
MRGGRNERESDMSGDLVFGDKWLVLMGLGAAGVFIVNRLGEAQIQELLYALDRVVYGLL